jgi:hypothetical protein
VEQDVASHAHGILQIAFDLVENVLGRTSEEDCASLGVLAFGEEGEVLVANLFDFEEAALGAHVGVLDVLDSVYDGGASGTGYSVIVRLAHSAEGRYVGLHEVMLSQV